MPSTQERGAAFLIATVMIAIVLSLSVTLLAYVTSGSRTAKHYQSETATLQLADAGIQKAIYCLKALNGDNCGGTYGDNYEGEGAIVMAGGKIDIEINCVGQTGGGGCGVDDTDVLITATGTDDSGSISQVQATATKIALADVTESFDFAVQAGNQSFVINKKAMICRGDVFSDTNVDCGSGGVIKGNLYVSGEDNLVEKCTVRGDVHADFIKKSEICCDAYYDDGISGESKIGGTLYPNSGIPDVNEMPEMNLEHWRSAAEEGGTIYGDYEPGNGSSIGPTKIAGNFILGEGVQVTLEGPIWLTGNLHLKPGASLIMSSTFGLGSTVVLADNPTDNSVGGRIVLENGAYVAGSNQSGSYIILISTNNVMPEDQSGSGGSNDDCSGGSQNDACNGSCAIEVQNNSTGDAIFYALNGCLNLYEDSSAAALAGQSITLDKNVSVSYGCEVSCEEDGSGSSKICDCPDGDSKDTSCWCGVGAPDDSSICPTPGDILLVDAPEVWQVKAGTWHELK